MTEDNSFPEQSLRSLLSDYCTLQDERIRCTNELNLALKEMLESGNEKEYTRKTKNSTDMFKGLSEELKEIKDKIIEKQEKVAGDLILQIQEAEKNKLPLVISYHQKMLEPHDTPDKQKEIDEIKEQLNEYGEQINDLLSELKIYVADNYPPKKK